LYKSSQKIFGRRFAEPSVGMWLVNTNISTNLDKFTTLISKWRKNYYFICWQPLAHYTLVSMPSQVMQIIMRERCGVHCNVIVLYIADMVFLHPGAHAPSLWNEF
jgi:hypothetical protein